MATITIQPQPAEASLPLPHPLSELVRREPLFAATALFLAILALPTLFAMSIDTRMLAGVNVWAKPLKFELALFIYLATLAWYAGWLPQGVPQRRWYRVYTAVVAFCIVAEMVWLISAAALGVPSHFNTAHPVLAAVYPVMGLFALILTAATLVFGVLILRDRNSRLSPTFRLSLGLGLILTFVLTAVAAGAISSMNGHLVGGNLSDAEGAPLMGWARDGGDLRVAHFFATHALHIIPAFGLIASRIFDDRRGRLAVIGFSILFTAFVAHTFTQALSGEPFLPMIG